MTKIYCDKCGKETETKERISVDLPCYAHQSTYQIMGVWMKRYDLCIECFNKLKNWIDEDKKENNQ